MMDIEKAIEILTNVKAATNSAPRAEIDAAYQLGIEALRRILDHRLYNVASSAILLPGETEG